MAWGFWQKARINRRRACQRWLVVRQKRSFWTSRGLPADRMITSSAEDYTKPVKNAVGRTDTMNGSHLALPRRDKRLFSSHSRKLG